MTRRTHGSGSVASYETKRGIRWSYSIWMEGRDGKRKTLKRGGFVTRRNAEKALREALAERDRGTLLEPAVTTVERYAREVYLPHAARRVRPHTFASYEGVMRRSVFPHLGSIPLQRLTPAHVNAMLDAMNTAPRTKRLALTVLGSMLRLAVAEGLLVRNPVQHPTVTPPRVGRRPATLWTPAEVRTFLTATKDDPLGPVWRLLAYSGMRRAEVLALRWCDLDLDAGTLTVNRSLAFANRQPVFSEGKTVSARRVVSLDSDTVDMLRRLRMEDRQAAFGLAQVWSEERLLFRTARMRPMHPDSVSNAFRKTHKRLGLPGIRLHDLRHGFATAALEAGVPLKTVSDMLGHSSISITADVYGHTSNDSLRTGQQAVADLYNGSAKVRTA